MSLADTNAVGLYGSKETTWGETPATPVMNQIRYTGESLGYTKNSVQSAVIRDDRMRDQVALVGFKTEGEFNIEFAFSSFDDYLESALASTWVPIKTLTATTLAAVAASSKITSSANAFTYASVGDFVEVSGFATAANNGRFQITAVAANGADITLDATLVNESATPSVTIKHGAYAVFDDVTVAAADNSFNSASVNFLTAIDLVVGQNIKTTGFTTGANNGIFKIVSIVAGKIIVSGGTLVNETPGSVATVVMYGRRLKNGTTKRSHLIEKRYTDVTQFISFTGMRTSKVSLSIAAQEIITGSFGFMGKTAALAQTTVAGSSRTATTTNVLTGSANVGTIKQNGTAIAAALKSITLELNNNLREQTQIGTVANAGIGYGFLDVTGTIDAYFETETLYDQLIGHDTSAISFVATDDGGNIYLVTLPKIYFMTGNPFASGGNNDVMLPLEYAAVVDTTTSCMIQIDSFASPTLV